MRSIVANGLNCQYSYINFHKAPNMLEDDNVTILLLVTTFVTTFVTTLQRNN